jgi:hypothetical protein
MIKRFEEIYGYWNVAGVRKKVAKISVTDWDAFADALGLGLDHACASL